MELEFCSWKVNNRKENSSKDLSSRYKLTEDRLLKHRPTEKCNPSKREKSMKEMHRASEKCEHHYTHQHTRDGSTKVEKEERIFKKTMAKISLIWWKTLI